MSRIYFHTEHHDTAEVKGWERAHLGGVVDDIAKSFFPYFRDSALAKINPRHRLHHEEASPSADVWFRRSLEASFRHEEASDTPMFVDELGNRLSTFSLALNTVLAIGNDALCLMARIHATCEIHGYFEGPDRAWVAETIGQGRACGLMRADAGWEEVQDLLLLDDENPVVMSYSVCESFPNNEMAVEGGWRQPLAPAGPGQDEGDREPDWDAFYELDDADRWRWSLAGLRKQKGIKPISPTTLRGHKFGHGKSLIDIYG